MLYFRNIISKKISSNQFYTFDNKMIYSCCALSILLQRSNRCHYLIICKSYSWSQTFYNLIASQCGFHSLPILNIRRKKSFFRRFLISLRILLIGNCSVRWLCRKMVYFVVIWYVSFTCINGCICHWCALDITYNIFFIFMYGVFVEGS